jgi:hypothetical protein
MWFKNKLKINNGKAKKVTDVFPFVLALRCRSKKGVYSWNWVGQRAIGPDLCSVHKLCLCIITGPTKKSLEDFIQKNDLGDCVHNSNKYTKKRAFNVGKQKQNIVSLLFDRVKMIFDAVVAWKKWYDYLFFMIFVKKKEAYFFIISLKS